VLGLRPLDSGWSRFAVEPRLGALGWAEATVPAPQGDIAVAVREGVVEVTVPAGTVLVTAHGEHVGPATVHWESDAPSTGGLPAAPPATVP
jgi:alpha-L-rhamnosidase